MGFCWTIQKGSNKIPVCGVQVPLESVKIPERTSSNFSLWWICVLKKDSRWLAIASETNTIHKHLVFVMFFFSWSELPGTSAWDSDGGLVLWRFARSGVRAVLTLVHGTSFRETHGIMILMCFIFQGQLSQTQFDMICFLAYYSCNSPVLLVNQESCDFVSNIWLLTSQHFDKSWFLCPLVRDVVTPPRLSMMNRIGRKHHIHTRVQGGAL